MRTEAHAETQQFETGTARLARPVTISVCALRAAVDEMLFAVTVECYAGYRGEQTPRALMLGDRRIEIRAVLDRWLAPDHRYFKLQGDDGDTYLVRHAVASGLWELTMYQRGPGNA